MSVDQRHYVSPQQGLNAYTCPYCGAYSAFRRAQVQQVFGGSRSPVDEIIFQYCAVCDKRIIWDDGVMVHPISTYGLIPNSHLPEDIKSDYEEARKIAGLSPRGASALLRLAIDKLTKHVGAEGKTLDARIANLVSRGLDSQVQQMLDAVRVVGNEAVHPGQVDLRDDPEMMESLFWLVNEIADEMIAKPARINSIYSRLPESKQRAIEARDSKARQK
jgi:hypothetical protein